MFLNWCFSSIREINRLKRKGKCVLLFNVFNGCYTVINSLISKGMSNITIEKNVECLKRRFSRKENLKKCSSFERAKRYKIYSRKSLLRHYRLQLSVFYRLLLSTKLYFRFILICFAQEINRFYQSSLENEVDFTDIMNVSPNILAKN